MSHAVSQVQVSVRVPFELARALEAVATENDRTVSAELRRLIRHHVLQFEDQRGKRTV